MDIQGGQKPRRLRGTYANKASVYTALGIIGFSFGLMALNEIAFGSLRKIGKRYGTNEFARSGDDLVQPLTIIPYKDSKTFEMLIEEGKNRSTH